MYLTLTIENTKTDFVLIGGCGESLATDMSTSLVDVVLVLLIDMCKEVRSYPNTEISVTSVTNNNIVTKIT